MAIYQITFSPTGGTRKVTEAITSGMGDNIETLELCVPASKLTEVTLDTDDVAVIAMPVYGGRIPALAIERLQSQVKAGGAQCVIVAVYGNRAYDDALLEMFNTCTEMGLRVVAAVGAVAEHSIVRKYGAGTRRGQFLRWLDEEPLQRYDKLQRRFSPREFLHRNNRMIQL